MTISIPILNRLLNLSKSHFVRSVAVVASGTAAAQAITVLFSPIITRLYGPEAFGVLGVFNAVVSTFVPVASLAYVHAIVLPKEDRDAYLVLRLSLFIAVVMAGLCALFIIPMHEWLAQQLGAPMVAPFLFLIPIVILFSAAEQAYSQWLIRCKRFTNLSKVSVAQALGVNVMYTGTGLIAPGAGTLIGVATVGHFFHAWLLRLGSRGSVPIVKKSEDEKVRMRDLAGQYRDFPMYRAPQQLLNAVSQGLPAVLLSVFFGPAAAGFYVLSSRVLRLPADLVSQSVGKVFLPRVAEAARNGENLQRLIIKATMGLAAVGLVPFGLIILAGPTLFGFVFGADWVTAGHYSRWLALWLFFGFINRPSVQAIPILGVQGQFLLYECFSLALRIGSLAFGGLVLEYDLGTIMLFAIVGAVINLILILWVVWRSRGPIRASLTPV